MYFQFLAKHTFPTSFKMLVKQLSICFTQNKSFHLNKEFQLHFEKTLYKGTKISILFPYLFQSTKKKPNHHIVSNPVTWKWWQDLLKYNNKKAQTGFTERSRIIDEEWMRKERKKSIRAEFYRCLLDCSEWKQMCKCDRLNKNSQWQQGGLLGHGN